MADNSDFASMLAEFEQEQSAPTSKARAGDMITGTIISIGREAVFVDLGGKSEGVLDRDQVIDDEGELTVAVGDRIEARVVDAGGKSGTVMLRRSIAKGAEARAELAQAFELGMPVAGVVTGSNKGGVEVQVAGLRAFCPVSQLDNKFVEDVETFVGRKLEFRISKFEDGKRPNLVLSRRALLDEAASKVAESLSVGDRVEGTVTQLRPFGAFVDIGGVEGMIHVSELSHARVSDPSEAVAIGDHVEAVVIKMEPGEGNKPPKIGLSRKSLMGDPWREMADDIRPGTVTTGTVVRLQPFGAFIELRPGIEGLAHISELSSGKRIHHPRDVLEVGEKVEVTILSLDSSKQRISLSLKAAGEERAAREEAENIRDNAPRAPKSLGTMGDLFKGVKID